MQRRDNSHHTSLKSNARVSTASLAEDLALFQSRGGTIEKLGNTQFFSMKPAPENVERPPTGAKK